MKRIVILGGGFGGMVSACYVRILCAQLGMPITTAPGKAKQPGKDTRVFARISTRDKRLIEKAAAVVGQSVGAFVIAQARTAAAELLENHSVIRLHRADSRRLVEALVAPPKPPTAAMKKGMKTFRKSVISDVNPDSPTYRRSVALW